MDASIKGRSRDYQKGQAAIEMALALPFLIWLIYYTINAFYSIHTAHIGQKYAAMGLWERVNYRAKLAVDDVANVVVTKQFMAVRYTDPSGNIIQRKINTGPEFMVNIIGICNAPAAECAPQ